jgi:hypothetical protein
VRHVWVDGRKVVWNRTVLNVDEERTMEEVNRLAARIKATL